MNKCWYCVNALKFDKECWYFFWQHDLIRNKCGLLVTVQKLIFSHLLLPIVPSPPVYVISTAPLSSSLPNSYTQSHIFDITSSSVSAPCYLKITTVLSCCLSNVQPSSPSPCHSSGYLESLIESFQKQLTFEWTLLLLAINFVSFLSSILLWRCIVLWSCSYWTINLLPFSQFLYAHLSAFTFSSPQ